MADGSMLDLSGLDAIPEAAPGKLDLSGLDAIPEGQSTATLDLAGLDAIPDAAPPKKPAPMGFIETVSRAGEAFLKESLKGRRASTVDIELSNAAARDLIVSEDMTQSPERAAYLEARRRPDATSIIGEAMKGTSAGVLTNPKLFGGALEGAGAILMSPTLEAKGREIAKIGAEELKRMKPKVGSITQVGSLSDFAKFLAYGAGQGVGTSAPAIISGALTAAVTANPLLGFAVGAFGQSYWQNFGDVFLAARDDKDIQERLRTGELNRATLGNVAAAAAVPIAALDATGLATIMGQAFKPARTELIRRLVKAMGTGAITEGSTEAMQDIVSGWAREYLGAQLPFAEKVNSSVDNFFMGAAGGALIGGGAHVVSQASRPSNADVVGRELQASVEGAQPVEGSAERQAVASLSPERAQLRVVGINEPIQVEATLAGPGQTVQPAGTTGTFSAAVPAGPGQAIEPGPVPEGQPPAEAPAEAAGEPLQAFPTSMQAAVEAKRVKKLTGEAQRVIPHPTEEGMWAIEPILVKERTKKQLDADEKMRTRRRAERRVNLNDPITTAIGKLGGFRLDQAMDVTGDNKPMRAPFAKMMFLVRREGGEGLDGMRESLTELGYLPEGASINDMIELVQRELAGEKQFSVQADESVRMGQAEPSAEEEQQAEAADFADLAGIPEFEGLVRVDELEEIADFVPSRDSGMDGQKRVIAELSARLMAADEGAAERVAMQSEGMSDEEYARALQEALNDYEQGVAAGRDGMGEAAGVQGEAEGPAPEGGEALPGRGRDRGGEPAPGRGVAGVEQEAGRPDYSLRQPSPEYQTALEKFRAASSSFRSVQDAYRARKVGDAEYLSARKSFDAAQREMDAAEAAEDARGRPDYTLTPPTEAELQAQAEADAAAAAQAESAGKPKPKKVTVDQADLFGTQGTLFQTPYINPRQFELDLEHIYDNAETRPGTTPAQQAAGIAALRALYSRDRRAGATVLGSNLWRDFAERKGTELVGQRVSTASDLATLAQILRDSRFETLRFFFTQGNTVVGHTGLTSRLPGQVSFVAVPRNIQKGTEAYNKAAAVAFEEQMNGLRAMMGNLKADGFFVLHNHPSGVSTPSIADEQITRQFARSMLGFRGHVVIDHGEYSVIDKNGASYTKAVVSPATGPAELAHDALGTKIVSDKELARLVVGMQTRPGYATLISTDAQMRVAAIAEVPERSLTGTTRFAQLRAQARVRRFTDMTGSTNAFLVHGAGDPARFDALIADGVVVDAVDDAGTSRRANGGPLPPSLPAGRRSRSPITVEQRIPPGYTTGTQPNQLPIGLQPTAQVKRTFVINARRSLNRNLTGPPAPNVVEKSLGRIANVFSTPRTIAAFHPPFVPVFRAAANEMAHADALLAGFQRTAQPYFDLKDPDMAVVNKILEHDRLTGQIGLAGANMTVTTTAGAAELTKPGEIITVTPEQKAGYWALRRSFNDALEGFRNRLLEEVGLPPGLTPQGIIASAPAGATSAEKARLKYVAERVQEIEDRRRAGYVPFQRFGEVALVVRGQTGDVIHSERVELGFWSPKELSRIRDIPKVAERLSALRQKYPGQTIIDPFFVEDGAFAKKVNLADVDLLAEFGKMDAKTWEEAREALQFGRKATGWRSHLLKARNIPGYSTDFRRSSAQYFIQAASFLARQKYANAWRDGIAAIPVDERSRALHEYAVDYERYFHDPAERWALLRSINYAVYLSSPSTWVVNATQVPFVSIPWALQFAPAHLVTGHFLRAEAETLAMFAPNKVGFEYFDATKAPADVRQAVQKAFDEGMFYPLVVYEALGVANARVAQSRQLSKAGHIALETVGAGFTTVERMNRIATFIALYRIASKVRGVQKAFTEVMSKNALAQAEVIDDWSPFNFGKFGVHDTHFVQGKLNQARFQRGEKYYPGPLLAQFMGYPQGMIERMITMGVLQGGAGAAGAMLLLMIIAINAGIWGLPGAKDMRDLLEKFYKFFRKTDRDFDREMREAIVDVTGSLELAKFASGGAWRTLPDAVAVDMSSKLGLGTLIPNNIGGVTYDYWVTKTSRSMDHFSVGNYGLAMAEMMPRLVGDPVIAYDWSRQGIHTGKDKTLIPPENVTVPMAVKKAFGWTDAQIAEVRERERAEQRIQHAVDEVSKMFLRRLTKARAAEYRAQEAGDKAAEAQALAAQKQIDAEIQAWNADHRDYEQVVLSIPAQREALAKELQGAERQKGQRKKARGEIHEIQRLYGTP